MKRKYLYIIGALFILVIVAGKIIYNSFWGKDTESNNNTLNEFQEMTCQLYEGNAYTVKKHYSEGKTVLVFFSPDCDLCDRELTSIVKNKDLFTNNRWVFVSFAFMKDEIGFFLETHAIDKLDNSVILLEDSPKYHAMYQVVGPPALFVYDKKGKLIHSSYGSVEDATLIEWLQ